MPCPPEAPAARCDWVRWHLHPLPGLVSLWIPGTIGYLDSYAFFTCLQLTEIHIRGIPDEAFCTALSQCPSQLTGAITLTLSELGVDPVPLAVCDRSFAMEQDSPRVVVASRSTRAARSPPPERTALATRSPFQTRPPTVTHSPTESHSPPQSPDALVPRTPGPSPTVWASVTCGDLTYQLNGTKLTVSGPGKTVTRECIELFETPGGGSELESAIRTVYIESGVAVIDHSAFRGQPVTFVSLPSTLKSILTYAFAYPGDLNTIVFPESLLEIGVQAFLGAGLWPVHIPASLRSIENAAFAGCPSSGFAIASGNPLYAARDGVLYNANLSTLLGCPRRIPRTTLVTFDATTAIVPERASAEGRVAEGSVA
jgi:hypothetical protein